MFYIYLFDFSNSSFESQIHDPILEKLFYRIKHCISSPYDHHQLNKDMRIILGNFTICHFKVLYVKVEQNHHTIRGNSSIFVVVLVDFDDFVFRINKLGRNNV